MKKFKYKVVGMDGGMTEEAMTRKLNILGQKGWELCSVQLDGSYIMIFKCEVEAK